jgi:hypothetical protein
MASQVSEWLECMDIGARHTIDLICDLQDKPPPTPTELGQELMAWDGTRPTSGALFDELILLRDSRSVFLIEMFANAWGLHSPEMSETQQSGLVETLMEWGVDASEFKAVQSLGPFASIAVIRYLLTKGLEDVKLAHLKVSTVIDNTVLYAILVSASTGMMGHSGDLRRLCGSMLAYTIFDHVCDGLHETSDRAKLRTAMLRFWKTGRWNSPQDRAVAHVLTGPVRRACSRARKWSMCNRAVRIGLQAARMEELAQKIASDCEREHLQPAPETVGVLEPDAITESVGRNAPAIAFVLTCFLDNPAKLTVAQWKTWGSVAVFTQLLDDLLDQKFDRTHDQRTAVAALTSVATDRLLCGTLRSVPHMCAQLAQHFIGLSGPASSMVQQSAQRWTEAIQFVLWSMIRYRNLEQDEQVNPFTGLKHFSKLGAQLCDPKQANDDSRHKTKY